jgi:hypothetical protein
MMLGGARHSIHPAYKKTLSGVDNVIMMGNLSLHSTQNYISSCFGVLYIPSNLYHNSHFLSLNKSSMKFKAGFGKFSGSNRPHHESGSMPLVEMQPAFNARAIMAAADFGIYETLGMKTKRQQIAGVQNGSLSHGQITGLPCSIE